MSRLRRYGNTHATWLDNLAYLLQQDGCAVEIDLKDGGDGGLAGGYASGVYQHGNIAKGLCCGNERENRLS